MNSKNLKNQPNKIDMILTHVLYTRQTPDDILHHKVLLKWKENEKMNKKSYKKIAVAAAFALIFVSSNFISYAATGSAWIQKTFNLGNGAAVEIEEGDNYMSVTIEGDSGEYILVENDRLYFTFNDEKIDITDQCSSEEYFKYEYTDENDIRHVIFAGGTIDDAGWGEYIFNSDGTYLFNSTHINGTENPSWLTNAEISIGVPTGDPEIDFE